MQKLTGLQRAAVIIATLDKDTARELLKEFSTAELRLLSSALDHEPTVTSPVALDVIEDFCDDVIEAESTEALRPTLDPDLQDEVKRQAHRVAEALIETSALVRRSCLALFDADVRTRVLDEAAPEHLETLNRDAVMLSIVTPQQVQESAEFLRSVVWTLRVIEDA